MSIQSGKKVANMCPAKIIAHILYIYSFVIQFKDNFPTYRSFFLASCLKINPWKKLAQNEDKKNSNAIEI